MNTSTYSAEIGTDSSVDLTDDCAPTSAAVHINASNGTVYVSGPFDGWMGYAELADFDTPAEGIALAKRIAANPATELDALGYDRAGWFVPSDETTQLLASPANAKRLLDATR